MKSLNRYERAVFSLFVASLTIFAKFYILPVPKAHAISREQSPVAPFSTTLVFINEIHYENAGTDVNEGVEIAGPAGTNLIDWNLVLYNGSEGASYTTTPLIGTIPDEGKALGRYSLVTQLTACRMALQTGWLWLTH
jgi:hypothetical protein